MSVDQQTIISVWQKGKIIPGNNPNVFRQDSCGAWLRFSDYGNRQSKYGWEIDHITSGGPDYLSNLRPLHWRNNVEKSNGRLACAVASQGAENIAVRYGRQV